MRPNPTPLLAGKSSRAALALLCLAAVHACAGDTAPKVDLARKVVAAMQSERMFQDAFDQCMEKHTGGPLDPESVWRADPKAFGGLAPGTKYWPEVEALYDRYRSEYCRSVKPDGLVELVVQRMAERTSEDDLRAALAFYSSDAGKRLQESGLVTYHEIQAHIRQAGRENTAGEQLAFRRDLEAIVRKSLADPN